MDIRNRLAAQADVRRYIRRYEGRPIEYDDVAYGQEMANQAVVLESIDDSRLNDAAALIDMAIGTDVVIVEKRVNERRTDGKVSDRQKSEPTAGANI